MARSNLSTHVVGYLGELLVEVDAIIGSEGRLTSFRPGVDVDHKDLIFDERGRNRNVYVQVKTALAPSPNGVLSFRASFPAGDVPESPRLVYVLAHLDVKGMALKRIWLVASPDFNRLATRSKQRGGVSLMAAPWPNKTNKWSPFLIAPEELGRRLLDIAQHAPAEAPLDLPGALLMLSSR